MDSFATYSGFLELQRIQFQLLGKIRVWFAFKRLTALYLQQHPEIKQLLDFKFKRLHKTVLFLWSMTFEISTVGKKCAIYVVSISHFNGKLSTIDEIVLRIYLFKGLQLLVPIETKYRNRIESPQGSHLLLNIRKCQLFECSIFVGEVLMKMLRRAWMLS